MINTRHVATSVQLSRTTRGLVSILSPDRMILDNSAKSWLMFSHVLKMIHFYSILSNGKYSMVNIQLRLWKD